MHPAQRKFLRFLAGLVVGLAIALSAGVGGFMAWVAAAPRALDMLTPHIEKAFHSEVTGYSVKINQTWLVWDNWRHPINIRLRGVRILTKEGQVFSSFPEVAVNLDVPSLFKGQVLPRSVTLEKPIISLFQNPDRSISFGFRQEKLPERPEAEAPAEQPPESLLNEMIPTVPFAAVLQPLMAPDSKSNLRKLHSVNIYDADVSIGNVRRGVFFQATQVAFVASRNRHGTLEISTQARLRYSAYQSTIGARFVFVKDKPTVDGAIDFKGLEPSRLASFFTDSPNVRIFKAPLSGSTSFTLDMNGLLERARFKVESGMGEITTDHLIRPVQVNWAHLEGQISNTGSDIQINALRANLEDMIVTGDGVMTLSNDDAAVRASINIKNVAGDKLPLVWPPELAPQSREWVTENIKEGYVSEAGAKINIQFGDLAKPVLPRESVDANIRLENGKIRYLPEHPEVTNVKGNIHIDGIALDARIESADYMKSTKINKGQLLIDDLNAENPYIKVSFTADTTAKDVVQLLRLPRLKHAEHLNLTDAAEGTAIGTAALGFHFYTPTDEKGKSIGEEDIDYQVVADLKNISQPGFMRKFDISNASGAFIVSKTGVEFRGKGEVNGARVSDATVKYLFEPAEGLDTFVDVGDAAAPVESLPRFGYPALPFLKGALGVKANVKLGDKIESYKATIDLANATIHTEDIGWNKPAGQPAKLDIAAEKRGEAMNIPSFHLTGDGMNAKGSAALNKEMTDIERVTLDKYDFGKNNLDKVHYEIKDGAYIIEAQGKSADLGPWMDARSRDKESKFSFEHFPATQLKVDIGQVTMGKGHVQGVKGTLNCTAIRCENADLTGKMDGDKSVNLRILRNPKGQRQLSLHAEDAGSFLKAFNVLDTMHGGGLTLTGNYDDRGKSSLLNARLDIREFTMKDAPILAKILSLASLTGFFDTLAGKGIAFHKLSAPFTLHKDVFTIKKGKTYGPAIGLTMEGTITMPNILLDIEGDVVPSYTLNSMAGKVPVVGQLLTGGEGKGVFAARYSVKGTEKDPKVTVNPLAILTPGFLRGLFDIFERPEPQLDQQ